MTTAHDIDEMIRWVHIYAEMYEFSLSYEIDSRFLTVYIFDQKNMRTTMQKYDYCDYAPAEIETMLENFMLSERLSI